MKTTVELDERKLETIMRSMGFKTRKEAIDWALTEAERLAVMHQIRSHPWSSATLLEGMDPGYDALASRREVRSRQDD
jgi:hypothetical protein